MYRCNGLENQYFYRDSVDIVEAENAREKREELMKHDREGRARAVVSRDVWPASTGGSHVRVVVDGLENDPDTVIFGHYLWSTVTQLQPPTEGRFHEFGEAGTIRFRPTMSAGFFSKRPLPEVYEVLAAQLEALGWHRLDEMLRDPVLQGQVQQGRWVVTDEDGVENVTCLIVQKGHDAFLIGFEYGPGADYPWGGREKRGHYS